MARDGNGTINLKHIEAYEAIAATGSTVAAAVELGISQSNTSRLLQQLEDYLGVRLFYRDKNRLSPTREGLQLGPDIRAVFDRLRALKVSAREMEAGRSNEILLGLAFPGSLTMTLVPRLVKRFLSESGPGRIEVASGDYVAIERMVADGEADLGFARLPLAAPGLREEARFSSRHVCVMHPGHALATAESLGIAQLKGHDLILLNRERPARHELEALLYAQGLRKRPVIEAHSVGSACALAAQGLGVAIVSELLARECDWLPLAFVALEPALPVSYAVVSSDLHPLSRAAERFVGYLKAWGLAPVSPRATGSAELAE